MTEQVWPTGVVAAAATDPIVCPYLGLAGDPRSHFAFATTDHRCYSGLAMKVISVTHQGSLCLSEKYAGCRRYVVPPPATTPAVPTSGIGAALTLVSGSAARTSGATGRRAPVVPAAVILVAVLILALAAAWFASRGGSSPDGASGSAGSSPAGIVSSPTFSPQPTPSFEPSSAPTSSPAASPAPSSTTHVVKFGETLSLIASRYGVTVQALQDANGLTDPNLIVVGQRLIIPAP